MVKLNFKIIFVISVILLNVVSVFGEKYSCSLSDNSKTCTISGLKLTKSNYKIEPVTSNPSAVTTIYLYGIVPVLSSGICEALPNLNKFVAMRVLLEEIEDFAFQECKKLTYLDLDYNNILKLGINSFKGMFVLEELWLYGGNLPSFDLDLSDLKQLKRFGSRVLNITVFPADMLREQKHLTELRLYSNNLFDLDIEGILEYAPSLKEIYLNDNNFRCTRLKEILSLLKNKGITIYTSYDSDHFNRRYFTPHKIENIHCLSDHQWVSELLKDVSFSDDVLYFKYLQTIPLGKSVLKMLTNITKNSAQINTVEIETKEQLTSLANQHQDLNETHTTDIFNLKSNIDDLIEKDGNLQKKVDKIEQEFTRTAESLNTKIDEKQEILTNLMEEKFENLTKLFQILKEELNQVEQQRRTLDDSHDIHQTSLWSFVVFNFVLVAFIAVYLIKVKCAQPTSEGRVSNVVYYTK